MSPPRPPFLAPSVTTVSWKGSHWCLRFNVDSSFQGKQLQQSEFLKTAGLRNQVRSADIWTRTFFFFTLHAVTKDLKPPAIKMWFRMSTCITKSIRGFQVRVLVPFYIRAVMCKHDRVLYDSAVSWRHGGRGSSSHHDWSAAALSESSAERHSFVNLSAPWDRLFMSE